MLIRFHIRTITPTFRRANVCVRLYGFTSALSLAPHHVLASLVKGRWIDGKAQALILFLSVCDTPTFFYLSNFSAVKTEGLLYTTDPSKTALSLEKGEVLLLGQAEPTTVGIVVA